MHVWAPHEVPAGWNAHWPLPLQRPVVPQLVEAVATQTAAGSRPLAGTGWQVPALPATAQDKQLGQLADPQQTPSTQLALVHSAPATHDSPLGFRVQEPDRQNSPGMQSASAVQAVRQAAGPHLYGAHMAVAVWSQPPLPSQWPTAVYVAPVHDATPQLVLVGACRQPPLPSQVPMKPHGVFPMQPPCGSRSPAGTGRHVPARPVTAHDWQLPHVGDEQQTPSTQLLLSQSAATLHSCPSAFMPHDPALHSLPGAQSLSLPHAALHVMPLHPYAPHDCVTAAVHMPLPLQVRGRVAVGGLDWTGQVAGAHWTPAA